MDLAFLHWLEGLRTPALDRLFLLITTAGEDVLFMIAALVVLWCVEKRAGYYLLYVGVAGQCVNMLLKNTFMVPRPWVRDPTLNPVPGALAAASGYSFPSGHTQTASGLYIGFACLSRVGLFRALWILLTLAVGFSRLYLGVHTPQDVLVSLLLGSSMAVGFYPLFTRSKGASTAWQRLSLLCWIGVLGAVLLWSPGAAALTSGQRDLYKLFGAALGFLLAWFLDEYMIGYTTAACWWAQLCKVTLGAFLLIVLRLGLKTLLYGLLGDTPIADAARYFAIGVFGGAVWPMTFGFWARLGRSGTRRRR